MEEFGHMKQTRAWSVNPGSNPGAPFGNSEVWLLPNHSKGLAVTCQI